MTFETTYWACGSGCPGFEGEIPFCWQDPPLMRATDKASRKAWYEEYGEPMPPSRVPRTKMWVRVSESGGWVGDVDFRSYPYCDLRIYLDGELVEETAYDFEKAEIDGISVPSPLRDSCKDGVEFGEHVAGLDQAIKEAWDQRC